MSTLIDAFIQWLHGLGLHVAPQTADAAGRMADQVGDAVGRATAGLDMPGLLALAAALGWASGFRQYAVVFLVGAMGAAGWQSGYLLRNVLHPFDVQLRIGTG